MAVMLSILRMLSLWKTIINHGLLTIKAPSSAKSLLSSYSSELPDEQEEFDVKIKRFFTRKCTTIMKDQSDVYHYMNPSKNAPHFDELLNGKDLKKMIRKKGRNPINISILWIYPPPLSFHVLCGYQCITCKALAGQSEQHACQLDKTHRYFNRVTTPDCLLKLVCLVSKSENCHHWFQYDSQLCLAHAVHQETNHNSL